MMGKIPWPLLEWASFCEFSWLPGSDGFGGKGAGWWRGKGGRGGWDEGKCPSHQIPITVTSFGRPHWDMETWENQVIEHISHFLANLDHASQWQISSCKRVHNLKLSFHNLSFLHKHIIEPVKLITHSLQTNLVAKLKGFFSLLDISTHFPDTSIDSKKRFSDQIKFQIHWLTLINFQDTSWSCILSAWWAVSVV